MSETSIDKQLAKDLAEYGSSAQARENLALVQRIASLYEQKADLNTALEWYSYASYLADHKDPALTYKVAIIELKRLDRSIAEFETWLAWYPNAENAPEVRAQLNDLKARKAQAQLPDLPPPPQPISTPAPRITFFP